jgi:hypothetical protein
MEAWSPSLADSEFRFSSPGTMIAKTSSKHSPSCCFLLCFSASHPTYEHRGDFLKGKKKL